MKKGIIIFFITCFYTFTLFAQTNRGPRIINPSQAINSTIPNGGNAKFSLQVGLPILGKNQQNNTRLIRPLDIRSPWDILYLNNTFSDDYFTISKGYYGDKVKIEWELRNNTTGEAAVTGIKIYRRVYNPLNPNLWGQPIVNLSASATNYEDKYIEGGVLYEYKVYATGVNDLELVYKNFITGIGFRSPTAIVTGNINYKGGNPVKDVLLVATSNGGNTSANKALKVPAASFVDIINTTPNSIDTAATLQAWVKPFVAYTNDNGDAINMFKIYNTTNSNTFINATINYKATTKVIEVNIGGTLFKLKNYYPSGNTNTRGDDELLPVSEFNNRFTHFSAVIKNGRVPTLYINGRPISVKYGNDVDSVTKLSKDVSYVSPYFSVEISNAQNISTAISNNWDNIHVGGTNAAIIDEIRVWRKALDTSSIRTDFKRYISGNNTYLISYLNANEGAGSFAYDLSKNGFDYNDNSGKLDQNITWVTGVGNAPGSDQLGILGVTDAKGNYEITNIPYTGVGESYTITPMYGQHKFESRQQLVYLGQGSEVANKIDFTDVSSFSFKGVVLYDTRDVFPSFVDVNKLDFPNNKFQGFTDGDQFVTASNYENGYNYYKIGNNKYKKGEYWLNNAGTQSTTDDYLERYARIYVKGANVYVDGNIVLDENNMPVVTNDEGFFDVSVPIGNHAVTVKKDGHNFIYNGRFPETPGTFKEFFENAEEPVVFVDTTKVIVAGKVVGGAIEAAKKIGFGKNGFVSKTIEDSATGQNKVIEISAKNNIGIAKIIVGYKPKGLDATSYTMSTFSTNKYSGEYVVKLLPLLYELKSENLTLNTNNALRIIPANTTESLDFSTIPAVITPVFKYKERPNADSVVYATGSPYQFEKSYIYRSTPVLQVLKQTSDVSLNVNGVDMPIAVKPDTLVYTQFSTYLIKLKRYEHYQNFDTANKTFDVPVADGQLMETNNLAILGSSTVTTDSVDESILHYTFKAGLPNIAPPFTKSISLRYRVNNVDYPVIGLKSQGVILGGASDGSQTFVTQAPDLPAIILRDPPGSNSSAQITQGSTFSVNSGYSFANSVSAEAHIISNLGFKTTISGGMVPIPETEIEVESNTDYGTSLKVSSNDGKTVNSTYTFNKTISTSDQTDYVGSDGDLYIGNSKNVYYGSYDNIHPTNSIPKVVVGGQTVNMDPANYINIGTNDKPIYVSKQKALSFVEKPTSTFFMYSQKHILSVLIPEYTTFITTNLNSNNPDTTKIKQYREQIRIWRAVILDNEKKKYLAKNYRSRYKASISGAADRFSSEIKKGYSGDIDPVGRAILDSKLSYTDSIRNKLATNFDKNISFDAGLGQYDESIETTVLTSSNFNYDVAFEASVEDELGVKVNGSGATLKTKGAFELGGGLSLTQENAKSTNISYTIKDNDNSNYISVDVINAFDGNGPIFSTLGGRTSCPYEGSETSKFFPEEKFKNYFDTYFSIQDAINANNAEFDNITTTVQRKIVLANNRTALNNRLKQLDSAFASNFDNYADAEKASLSFATQKVEVPVLTVTNDNVTNISEGKNAEFELKFNNNSAAEVDATFRLRIDNTTNPNNAIINIDKNGTLVNVPYGKTTVYKMTLAKSISDVYEYNDIKVILESLCDGEAVSSSVLVSAKFVPSCTSVTIGTPAKDWVFNRVSAFNPDKSTKPMLINLSGYNVNFANFKQIDLEYKLAGTPNWNRLKTYYNSQTFYNESPYTADKALIGNASTLSYAFDLAARDLIDGKYEIRARSTCTNSTEFISDVTSGKLDLSAPEKFGTPTPIDGILGVGEDLKVTFNEPVSYNTAVSLVEIKGQTNQMKIDHNVTLYFEGANNTVSIANPKIANGAITLEYWMKVTNAATNATIIQQKDGLSIKAASGKIVFSIANTSASGSLPTDNIYHHYTFVYNQIAGSASIYIDDKSVSTVSATANFPIANNETLIIGGNTFAGNIHDFRIWNKSVSLTDSYAKMYNKLSGNEANLVGYWPMNEGNGLIAYDNSRFKHGVLNSNMWDIKPRGTAYEFKDGQYQKFDQVGNAVITNEMDATITFWFKSSSRALATILSNGKGDGTDVNQGLLDNKWSIQLNENGGLVFNSEGEKYTLSNANLADNNWHHVALLLNRQGAMKTYVDALEVSSNSMLKVGGFAGNRIWIGARGSQDLSGLETVDQKFTGKIDEVQIWNSLRSDDQIFRDRYFEIAPETTGLLFYTRMNQPDVAENIASTSGAKYTVYSSTGPETFRGLLNFGNAAYSTDAPAIKPERELINFAVNRVISDNEMIINPVVTDPASIEGQTLDITVNRMFDGSNNMQLSPITWTAYYRRNDVVWYADGYNDVVNIIKNVGEEKTFDIVVLNKSGVKRSFNILNVPRWLSLSSTQGNMAPNSKMVITATIDKDYATGEFIENMSLSSDFGFDEKLQVKLRILDKAPNWTVIPTNFNFSMNMIGRLKLNGVFSKDTYNTIAAFKNDTVVGVSKMEYNENYQQYFMYLTIYSNSSSKDVITFKAWDATEGKIKELTYDGLLSLNFIDNDIIGSPSSPVIFENTTLVEQLININKGWTWVSLFVNDPNFKNVNTLTSKLIKETGDRIMNGSTQEIYSKNIVPYTWSGSISATGGLSIAKMYKLYFATPQTFSIKGTYIDLSSWKYPVNSNWNWLPYPLPFNRLVSDALAYFDAASGDLIKSQTQFAIYDPKMGWTGTLKYLEPSKGYMLKSTKAQTFTFPTYLMKTLSKTPVDSSVWTIGQTSGTIAANATNRVATNSTISINEGNLLANEIVIKDFSKYTQNMNAVVLMPKGYNELQVFDDQDQLKGIAQREGMSDLAYLTIFGDKPQNLYFYVNEGGVVKKSSYIATFAANGVLGSVSDPVVLNFDSENTVKTYPNPFGSEFNLVISSNKEQKATVSIFSITSQLLFNQEIQLQKGTNNRKISFNGVEGVYLIKVQMDGVDYLKTIIKSAQ